jgi:hypothetical protein
MQRQTEIPITPGDPALTTASLPIHLPPIGHKAGRGSSSDTSCVAALSDRVEDVVASCPSGAATKNERQPLARWWSSLAPHLLGRRLPSLWQQSLEGWIGDWPKRSTVDPTFHDTSRCSAANSSPSMPRYVLLGKPRPMPMRMPSNRPAATFPVLTRWTIDRKSKNSRTSSKGRLFEGSGAQWKL